VAEERSNGSERELLPALEALAEGQAQERESEMTDLDSTDDPTVIDMTARVPVMVHHSHNEHQGSTYCLQIELSNRRAIRSRSARTNAVGHFMAW
jgi:hypothetical protein